MRDKINNFRASFELSALSKVKYIIFFTLLTLILSSCGKTNVDGNSSDSFHLKFKAQAKDLKADQYNYDFERLNSDVNFDDCINSSDKFSCYGAYLKEKLDNSISQDEFFQQLYTIPQNDCRDVYTIIGAYISSKKIYPIDFLNKDDLRCGDSLVQGFVNQHLATSKDSNELKSKFCDPLSKEQRWSCSIYLGSYYLSKNLKDPVGQSDNCYLIPSPDDSTGNHMTFRRACLSGLWQRFFHNDSVIENFKILKPKANDIFSFCLASKKSSMEVCLQEDSSPFWKLEYFNDINEKFKACRELDDANLVDQCNFGMGRGVSDSINRDELKLFDTCSSLTSIFDFEYCMLAAGEAMDKERFKKNISSICTSENDKCLISLGISSYGLNNGSFTEALEYCRLLPNGLSDLCSIGVFRGLNRLSLLHSNPNSVEDLYSRCDSYSGDVGRYCLLSVYAGSALYLDKIGGEESIYKYCNSLNFKELCGATISSIYIFEGKEITEETCVLRNMKATQSCLKTLGYLSKLFANNSNCDKVAKENILICKNSSRRDYLNKYYY